MNATYQSKVFIKCVKVRGVFLFLVFCRRILALFSKLLTRTCACVCVCGTYLGMPSQSKQMRISCRRKQTKAVKKVVKPTDKCLFWGLQMTGNIHELLFKKYIKYVKLVVVKCVAADVRFSKMCPGWCEFGLACSVSLSVRFFFTLWRYSFNVTAVNGCFLISLSYISLCLENT